MTICPCCGFQFEGELTHGCDACGARAVGDPLPKPDIELPSYARSLVLVITGSVMVLAFAINTVIALVKHSPIKLDFWSWVGAGETAAWQLKWIAIPVSILVFAGSRKLYRSMLATPQRYWGMGYARIGFVTSASVPLLIAFLIGVTVPARLEQRDIAAQAATEALGRTFDRAIFEYQIKFEKVPTDLEDLRKLPDADGSIATALKSLDPKTYPTAYKPSADVAAALPTRKPRTTVIKASLTTVSDETLADGLSFTNYELRLPGPDKLMGTDDDLILRDGLITKATDSPKQIVTSTASTKTRR